MKRETVISIFSMIVAIGIVALAARYLFNGASKNDRITSSSKSSVDRSYSGAVIDTNLGSFTISFLSSKAPKTVNNFITLADKGFYNGTKFHRVIQNFMIQGGDPLSKGDDRSVYGRGGPGYTFDDEINDEPMVRGMVAMANSGPNTNGSQFFIITEPETPWLQGKHTVFAEVVSGMDVVDAISKVQTDAHDIPQTPVVIQQITLD